MPLWEFGRANALNNSQAARAAQAGAMGYNSPGPGAYSLGAPGMGGSPYGASPYPGFSNLPYPGETGQQTAQRMQREYEMMGQRPLPDYWDAQRPGGAGNFGMNPMAGYAQGGMGGGMGGIPGAGFDPLEEQRRMAFQSLDRQRAMYNRGDARQINEAILAQLGGQDQPFGPNVTNALLADVSDAGAGMYGSQQDAIRQAMANQGLSGSGGELSAMLGAQRNIGAQTRKARRDITSRAELENFQARERAQGAAASFLRDRAQNAWSPTQAEVGLRSRFEVTGQSPNQWHMNVGTGTNFGGAQGSSVRRTPTGWTGGSSAAPPFDPDRWGSPPGRGGGPGGGGAPPRPGVPEGAERGRYVTPSGMADPGAWGGGLTPGAGGPADLGPWASLGGVGYGGGASPIAGPAGVAGWRGVGGGGGGGAWGMG